MEQQQAQELEQRLRENWGQIRHQILDRFVQVSTADLEAASNVNDLVRRIADRSHHTEPYVETRLRELVGVTAGGAQAEGEGAQPTAEAEGTQPAAEAEGGQSTAEAEQGGETRGFEQPPEPLGGPRQPFGGSEN
ncbi:hypothetical protein [Protofrankia symbiont of Coriaria ruscifolia]|uniref:hypothetical protein n=1 Tax=Protofrankia symbiont of Coriaria ruscifolia TaxID=1306542 RepID=UPI0010413F22|nr:hypothetical protein [Protofrankia symbiont of Coriaria ruscifolia]